MNLYIFKRISIFSVLFFLISCNFQNISDDKNILPSVTYTPTSILVENPTPTITSSIIQREFNKTRHPWALKKECIQISENPLQPTNEYAGNLIVNGNNTTYIVSLPSQKIIQFPEPENSSISSYKSNDFKSSPDNTMVAYIENHIGEDDKSVTKRKLRILNNDLNFQNLNTWTVEWQWPIRWLNSQELSVLVPGEAKEIFILNVIDGKFTQKDTSYILKNTDYVSSSWYIFGSPDVYFNTNATKSIFPVGANKISLWDVENQTELWSGENIDYIENANATWSTDGNIAIVTTANHTREEIVILNLIDMTAEAIPLNDYTNVENLSLSPNGKIVSAWVSNDNYGFSQQQLILINLSNKTIIETCIEISIFDNQPIWLGNQKISVSANDHGENKVLLVNIDDLIANTLVIDTVEPVAWLKNK